MHGCNRRHLHKCALRAFILLFAVPLLSSAPRSAAAEAPPHGSRLHNPFCTVPTYVSRTIGSQGLALIDDNGIGVIYIGREEAAGSRAYRDFLMAHECCHHTRGHLRRLKELSRENALLALSFVNRSVELDADCCAGAALARMGRVAAVREAARRMHIFGAMPTGAGGYPSGDLRAMLIEECAASGRATIPPPEPDSPGK
jgi:hypothetical protein